MGESGRGSMDEGMQLGTCNMSTDLPAERAYSDIARACGMQLPKDILPERCSGGVCLEECLPTLPKGGGEKKMYGEFKVVINMVMR